MSTKKTSDQTSSSQLQFDPGSKGIYDLLTQGGGKVLGDYINNPFGNAFYQLGLGQSQRGAAAQGRNNMGALQQMMKTSGLTGQSGAGFQQAQLGRMGRSNASLMSSANVNNIMAALQRQMQATGMGMAFQPLLTGEKGQAHSEEKTSGLGTWLPQLMSGLMQGAMGAATGGMSSLGSLTAGANALPAAGGFAPGSQFPTQFYGFGGPTGF